jgi:hypothetical protein
MIRNLCTALSIAALGIVASPGAASAATTSLEAGAYLPSNQGAAAAAVLSETLPLNLSGIRPQASIMVPFGTHITGRYALTGEVRTPGRAFFGVGGGFGKLNTNTGLLVEAMAGYALPFIRNTSVVVRFYSGDNPGIGSTGFAGLRIVL